MADFSTWTQENLARFAAEATDKLQEQADRIQQLQSDLKDALDAYRALLRTSEGRPLDAPSLGRTQASSITMTGTQGAALGRVLVTHQELAHLLPSESEGR